jgi:hypothetical protein
MTWLSRSRSASRVYAFPTRRFSRSPGSNRLFLKLLPPQLAPGGRSCSQAWSFSPIRECCRDFLRGRGKRRIGRN